MLCSKFNAQNLACFAELPRSPIWSAWSFWETLVFARTSPFLSPSSEITDMDLKIIALRVSHRLTAVHSYYYTIPAHLSTMAKRKQPTSTASTAPDFSISRRYTGVAAFNDQTEKNIARHAELKARFEVASRAIAELEESDDTAGRSDAMAAAQNLMKTVKDVSGNIGTFVDELAQLKIVYKSMKDSLFELSELDPAKLTQQKTADLLAAL
jgi:hypothetical protein